jgi:1-aminocyclopropane-1-carboxylate deaminase
MYSVADLFHHAPSPLLSLRHPLIDQAQIAVWVKRDDLLKMGPANALCGNKWRKLKYNLRFAADNRHHTMLTFGGAYSNHIAAVAAAGHQFQFKTIGCIRGEAPAQLNPTLLFAQQCGMHLHFMSRTAYRQKHTSTIQQDLKARFGSFYLIPEGGTNQLAIKGCKEMAPEIENQLAGVPDYYCLSAGTGGTAAGLIIGVQHTSKVLAFSALKGDFLASEVAALLDQYADKPCGSWEMITDYHFGGYARHKPDLINFINTFKADTGIPLDPVYTGKMFYGLMDRIKNGAFEKGSTIVAIHTGGLQGIAGFNQRFGNLII